MDKLFYPTLCDECKYLSMPGLKLNDLAKRPLHLPAIRWPWQCVPSWTRYNHDLKIYRWGNTSRRHCFVFCSWTVNCRFLLLEGVEVPSGRLMPCRDSKLWRFQSAFHLEVQPWWSSSSCREGDYPTHEDAGMILAMHLQRKVVLKWSIFKDQIKYGQQMIHMTWPKCDGFKQVCWYRIANINIIRACIMHRVPVQNMLDNFLIIPPNSALGYLFCSKMVHGKGEFDPVEYNCFCIKPIGHMWWFRWRIDVR